MKRCYDCGERHFLAFDDELLVCIGCSELVYPHERVGLFRGLMRRAVRRWHSNTADRAARGWRHT